MLENLQQIFSNPLWVFVGLVITITAIILAIVFYSRSKKVRKPRFYVRSHNLVTDFSSKITKLKMLYGDMQIDRLTVSKIAFWNDGTETIDKVDIANAEPLRIEAVGSYDILDANVIKEINPVNKFHVEIINKKEVRILFDFLDKGQGGAIQIVHTGKGSSDIKVDGFVKGGGKPSPSYTWGRTAKILDKIFPSPSQTQPIKPHPAKARRGIAIFSFFAALMMLVIFFSEGSPLGKVFGSAGFLIYVYFGYLLLKRRVPKGLEIVEEEEI